ncbi:transmembrane protein, putative [Medicago truncatula]|uniref:Transmembrane protein, putative n=1 Tax=Medicago truncatula TaxID=3880 RepID=A0A072U0G4_MEDTR|nr:transmembrane protein, putative [Medicago truncatula]
MKMAMTILYKSIAHSCACKCIARGPLLFNRAEMTKTVCTLFTFMFFSFSLISLSTMNMSE